MLLCSLGNIACIFKVSECACRGGNFVLLVVHVFVVGWKVLFSRSDSRLKYLRGGTSAVVLDS